MKKIFVLVLINGLLCACSGNESKNNDKKPVKDQKVIASMPVSAEDKATKEWLLGKEWKAEKEAAPIGTLRTYSADSCDYVYGKGPWNFKNNHLVFGANDLVEWPFVRLSDTTFTLYVAPTQKTYTYHFIKNL